MESPFNHLQHISDSDEGDDCRPAKRSKRCELDNNDSASQGDCIYSDGEDWYIPAQPATVEPGEFPTENQDANQWRPTEIGHAKVIRPLCRPAVKSARVARQPHRRLITSAAAKAEAARAGNSNSGARDDITAATRTVDETEVDWSQSFASQSVGAPAVSRGPVFVGRRDVVLPARVEIPLPSAQPPQQASRNTQGASGTIENSSQIAEQSAAPAQTQTDSAPYQPYCASRPAAPAPKVGNNGMVATRNADGLNVVYNKRKRAADSGDEGGKAKPRGAVNSGWGNNFVRIDLKKGRGSTKFQASRHSSKRRPGRGGGRGRRGGRWGPQRLRQVGDGEEFLEGWEGSSTVCFRCGGKGHWAKDCTQTTDEAAEAEAAAEAAVQDLDGNATAVAGGATGTILPARGSGPRQSFIQVTDPTEAPPLPPAAPLDIDVDALCKQDALEKALHTHFGFSSFRGLQIETIQRVLRGESCLSIMPTGMGKSLCYQLPALLMPGLTLVVSPLVALMHDQVRAAPPALRPSMLWAGQSPVEARRILAEVESGDIRLLFVSPERLANPHLLAALRPQMPLPLVVIDEAHCVAEWGHSFRPAYFRLGEILQRDLSIRSVLALTATATKATEGAVCSVLRIPATQVMRDSAIRSNLRLSVRRIPDGSTTSARAGWSRIVALFRPGGALAESKSAIVYCAWKSDANSLAAALTTGGINSKAYHAGLDYKERAGVEAAFSAGRLRVVTATVAFGMGVDIASVDAVVHATMPRSLEEYVQQIGRAGRDGREGKCFVYLNDDDFISLRSLAYSGFLLKDAVGEVLTRVFAEIEKPKGEDEACDDGQAAAGRRFGVLPTKKLAGEVDMQEESIEAVLGYLEANEQPLLRVLPKTSDTVKVSFYSSMAEQVARDHPTVAALMRLCPKPRNGLYTTKIAKLACAAQKTPGAALQDLQVLAQHKIVGFELSKEKGLAFEVLRTPDDMEELIGQVYARLSAMLRCQISRLDTSYRAMAASAAESAQPRQEDALRIALEDYFAKEAAMEPRNSAGEVIVDIDRLPLVAVGEQSLNTARAVIRRNREQGGGSLSALSLARVLHGMGGPAMPRDVWSKKMAHFWGSLRNIDFTEVFRVATLASNASE